MIPRHSLTVTAALIAVLGAAACVQPPMPASDSNPYGNSPVDTNSGGHVVSPLSGERFTVQAAAPVAEGQPMCLDVQNRYAPSYSRTAMVSGPCDKAGSEELSMNTRGQIVNLMSALCIVDDGVATLAPCSEPNTTTWRIDINGRLVASSGRCLTMAPRFGALATMEPCSDEPGQRLQRITIAAPLR